MVDFPDRDNINAFVIHYKGREVIMSLDEVMDVLGAKPIKQDQKPK